MISSGAKRHAIYRSAMIRVLLIGVHLICFACKHPFNRLLLENEGVSMGTYCFVRPPRCSLGLRTRNSQGLLVQGGCLGWFLGTQMAYNFLGVGNGSYLTKK